MTDTRATYHLNVNGESRLLETEASATLLDVLRADLGLGGTKYNCEQGECGACTVLVDGRPVNSCITLAATLDGSSVVSVEGLATEEDRLDHLQQAFLDFDAAQCGYCTPGMLAAAKGLVGSGSPTTDEIERGLAGNYCRCTGYKHILEAVEHVATSGGEVGGCHDCGNRSPAAHVPSEASVQRVTGQPGYLADSSVPNMLHASFVRVASPRAAIKAIDATAAEAYTGVAKVLTGADLLQEGSMPRFGSQVDDEPILALDETKYEGEPVAVVLAATEQLARVAAALVRVDYEELSPIIDRAAALSSPPLHGPGIGDGNLYGDSNVMGEWLFESGDLEEARAASTVIVEDVYRAPFAHHFAMELPACVARPEGAGVLVESPVQHPFALRRTLAAMLELPPSDVRVRSTPIGGSFGSKGYPKLEPVTAALALNVEAPVSVRLTAEEAFLYAQREASDIWMRTGFDDDGTIQFHEVEADFLIGAYTDISPRVVSKAGLHAVTPYRTKARKVRARALFTSTPPTTAFRGFGATHTVFALESQLDVGAERLGLDPVELRLRNVLDRGDEIYGDRPADGNWSELVTTTADAIRWSTPKKEGRGRGIAVGLKSCVPATKSSARVVLNRDLSVTLQVGTTEMGQGTHDTLRVFVADLLHVDVNQVNVAEPDTDVVPFDALTASSRSLVHMGNAVEGACRSVLEQLADAVRQPTLPGEPDRSQPPEPDIQHLLSTWHASGGDGIVGEGIYEAPVDASHFLGGPAPFYETVSTAVELEVDSETGIVTIHRIVHCTDAGKVLNRQRVSGVDEGGVTMGVGLALTEHVVFGEDALLRNASSLDYRIPTALDVPRIESFFVENGDGPGPYGSKGIGEGGVLAVAPAIASAIADCTGVRLSELPFTPERILLAMKEASA